MTLTFGALRVRPDWRPARPAAPIWRRRGPRDESAWHFAMRCQADRPRLAEMAPRLRQDIGLPDWPEDRR